jgi:glycosyltransferase involved in cell wall biosynthesis
MKVVFFQRNPGKKLFSIEKLFDSIRSALPDSIDYSVKICSKVNSGLFNKLCNIVEPLFASQGDVNHVTGDVHYLTFFLEKRKTILTIHDINLMYSTNKIKKAIHRWFWLKLPMSRAGTVTVISQTTKEELLKHVDYPAQNIRVIHNCVAPDFYPAPKPFNKQKPVLLQIGVKPNKNLRRLIPALEGISCTLQIIGQPSDEITALLATHRIDYSWKANLTDAEIVEAYVQCDMVVFVSTFEGFGLPIVEANMVERPVLTSNVSSMPEVAGQAACLVDPFDIQAIRAGVLRIIADDPYRKTLLENGRINRSRFTPASIAKAYSELYEEMVSLQRTASQPMVA